jgi:hypothetical protein
MKSKFQIETKIEKNNPYLTVFFEYKDSFTDDKFIIHSILNNTQNIKFEFYKNKSRISEINLLNNNYESFLKELFNTINDFDFKEDFQKNNQQNFIKEVSNFINEINSSIIIENKIIKGYKDKMRVMSGILENKNIR